MAYRATAYMEPLTFWSIGSSLGKTAWPSPHAAAARCPCHGKQAGFSHPGRHIRSQSANDRVANIAYRVGIRLTRAPE
jgi:hypothetical protein